MAVLHEYQWLVVVGSFAAFAFGWGTGSNDVANAFGTSVGSKALTLRQAVVIAAIFEFAGALLLGRVNTNVIAGGIANLSAFTREPEIYAYGMVCALSVGFVWQGLASFFELNVSATHSIIGAIMGFGLVYAGKDGVVWAVRDEGAFPPYKGVVAIILSWFVSPILSGLLSAAIFLVVRTLVLRRANAYNLSFWTLPPFVLVTTFVNMYFIFTKGAKKLIESESDSWSDSKAAWIAAACAGGVFVFTAAVCMPLLKWWTNKKFDEAGNPVVEHIKKIQGGVESGSDTEGGKEDLEHAAPTAAATENKPKGFFGKIVKAATHGMTVDVHDAVNTDARTANIHSHGENFQPRVEYAFSYLQIFSACSVIFAHGAGEVGYMAGPLATIWEVYQNGTLKKEVKPQIWIILIGALGLVIGLATYGYNVTRAMGVKMAKLSPTRGFAAELATAGVITIAAQYGLPTSSSQCVTGAIVGVGLVEGTKGVNWWLFGRQFISWVGTLFIVGLCTAALFAQGIYSPGKIEGESVLTYENSVANLTGAIYKGYNTTLYAFEPAATAGDLPNLSADTWATLNETIATSAAAAAKAVNASKQGSVEPSSLLDGLNGALTLLQDFAVNTLGQTEVAVGSAACTAADATEATCQAAIDLSKTLIGTSS